MKAPHATVSPWSLHAPVLGSSGSQRLLLPAQWLGLRGGLLWTCYFDFGLAFRIILFTVKENSKLPINILLTLNTNVFIKIASQIPVHLYICMCWRHITNSIGTDATWHKKAQLLLISCCSLSKWYLEPFLHPEMTLHFDKVCKMQRQLLWVPLTSACFQFLPTLLSHLRWLSLNLFWG